MKKSIHLTPAELEIMEAIWELGGSPSVREVLEYAYPDGEKAYTTIQTLMNRLVKKEILERKMTGLVHFYTPRRSRAHLLQAETNHLLGRFFGGSLPALANYLFKSKKMDLEEIRKIRKMLEEKEDQLKGDQDDHPAE